jgi:hypothetical protein
MSPGDLQGQASQQSADPAIVDDLQFWRGYLAHFPCKTINKLDGIGVGVRCANAVSRPIRAGNRERIAG